MQYYMRRSNVENVRKMQSTFVMCIIFEKAQIYSRYSKVSHLKDLSDLEKYFHLTGECNIMNTHAVCRILFCTN